MSVENSRRQEADESTADNNQTTVREAAAIPNYELHDVDGATLVYTPIVEAREHLQREVKIGRVLVGVTEVTDRTALRDELARLGHPVAEAHLLEEFDRAELGVDR